MTLVTLNMTMIIHVALGVALYELIRFAARAIGEWAKGP